MYLWQMVQQTFADSSCQSKIQSIYQEYDIPLEVRHYFYELIEDNFLQPNGPEPMYVHTLLEAMITTLEKKKEVDNQQDLMTIFRLNTVIGKLRFYSSCTPRFTTRMKYCLAEEKKLVEENSNASSLPSTEREEIHETWRQISEALVDLMDRTTGVENEMQTLKEIQEDFFLKVDLFRKSERERKLLEESQSSDSSLLSNARAKESSTHNDLLQTAQKIQHIRDKLDSEFKLIAEMLSVIHKSVLVELVEWQNFQQKQMLLVQPESLSAIFRRRLAQIQAWAEDLFDGLTRVRIQQKAFLRCKTAIPLGGGGCDLQVHINENERLLRELVEKTFVIESHPPQVIKKDAKFSGSVRHLVGRKLRGHILDSAEVVVDVLTESQAKSLDRQQSLSFNHYCVLSNNTSYLEYSSCNKTYTATFKNLALKSLRRADRRGTGALESVMEEKYRLVFRSQFKLVLSEAEFNLTLVTMSLPVVIIVHGCQEPKAMAVILWHNSFCNVHQDKFSVPDSVTWQELAEVLNQRWTCGDQVYTLGLEDILYLAHKLMPEFSDKMSGANSLAMEDSIDHRIVEWSHFYRDNLPGRNFTFWEWFYETCDLMRDHQPPRALHLRSLWNQHFLAGFLSKERARELLESTGQPGTFLIRFADSEKGAVSISWLAELNAGVTEVYHLKPFQVKDLLTRSLADRVRDLNNLIFLYPNIPKDKVFGNLYTSQESFLQPTSDGYVATDLKTNIPLVSASPNVQKMNDSSSPPPPTPFPNINLEEILESIMEDESPEVEFDSKDFLDEILVNN